MNTVITYSGTVEIRLKTKRYIQHNAGTKHLFNVITKLLCSPVNFSAQNLPGFVMLYDKSLKELVEDPSVDTNKASGLLAQYISVGAYQVESESSFSARFATSFGNSVLTSSSGSITNCSLALLDKSKVNILAVVSFNKDAYEAVKNGGQAQIMWTMTFTNGTDESSKTLIEKTEVME